MNAIMNQLLEHLAASKAPFQLVKHIEDVPAAKIEYPAFAEEKEDGVFCAVIVDLPHVKYVSRTGKPLYVEPWLDTMLREHHEPSTGLVYITELTCPGISLEVLSGLVNPNRKKPWSEAERGLMSHAKCYAHDVLTFTELLNGASERPFINRREGVLSLWVGCTCGKTVYNQIEFEAFAEQVIDRGGEGVVLKQLRAGWEAGHKGWRVTKYVRGISVDLECVGFDMGIPGTKREGYVARMKMRYKGNVLWADLGAGWTDEKRAELTQRLIKWLWNDEKPFGIFTVTALQESSTGTSLRLPKVGPERFDKDTPDA